jgi:hypothetical protein
MAQHQLVGTFMDGIDEGPVAAVDIDPQVVLGHDPFAIALAWDQVTAPRTPHRDLAHRISQLPVSPIIAQKAADPHAQGLPLEMPTNTSNATIRHRHMRRKKMAVE